MYTYRAQGCTSSPLWGDWCKGNFDLWKCAKQQVWKEDFLSTTTNEAPMPLGSDLTYKSEAYSLRGRLYAVRSNTHDLSARLVDRLTEAHTLSARLFQTRSAFYILIAELVRPGSSSYTVGAKLITLPYHTAIYSVTATLISYEAWLLLQLDADLALIYGEVSGIKGIGWTDETLKKIKEAIGIGGGAQFHV